jgi:hypothetical protein
MSPRTRLAVFLAVVVVICLATAGYLVVQLRDEGRATTADEPSGLPTTQEGTLLFRNTTPDQDFGQVEYVGPGSDSTRKPVGRRCDRLDVAGETLVCLEGVPGIIARTRVTVVAPGSKDRSWTVPGVPSRTRLSPDASRVATTVFVEGHDYSSARFATATEIGDAAGRGRVNLERYRLVLDGTTVRPVDRNFWGVTFTDDGDTFYATATTGGRTWLVRGSIRDQVLRSVHGSAECPSLSPDGRRVAYKKRDVRRGATWSLAVLDLGTGEETLLGERRSVDDQVEWLDDDTVLYGLPRGSRPGSSDVWALDVSGSARPRMLVPRASSPAVVRDGVRLDRLGPAS